MGKRKTIGEGVEVVDKTLRDWFKRYNSKNPRAWSVKKGSPAGVTARPPSMPKTKKIEDEDLSIWSKAKKLYDKMPPSRKPVPKTKPKGKTGKGQSAKKKPSGGLKSGLTLKKVLEYQKKRNRKK
tara:strand:- start:114 stop:488 length:375 start_codon:yes stop_codon:yes gene_type:complete